MMALMNEKIKFSVNNSKKMYLIDFEICVTATNGSHVVVTHQILLFPLLFHLWSIVILNN